MGKTKRTNQRPRKTRQEGHFQEKPKPKWVLDQKNQKERLQRLKNKVAGMSDREHVNMVLIVEEAAPGALTFCGSVEICHKLKDNLADEIQNCFELKEREDTTIKGAAQVKVEEPVKPANIEALSANPSMSTDEARKLLSSVVNPQKSQCVWGNPDCIPVWWPESIPFRAPDDVFEVKTDKGIKYRRHLNLEAMKLALAAWQSWMMEENQQSGESKMDDKNDIHQEDTIQDDVEHDVEDDGMDVTEDTLMTRDATGIIEAITANPTSLQPTELQLVTMATNFKVEFNPATDTQPKRLKKLSGFFRYGKGLPLFELIDHTQPPDHTRVAVYSHAIQHRQHLLHQWEKLVEDRNDLCADLDVQQANDSSETIFDMAIRKVLDKDSKPGSSVALFMAICLQREVFLYNEGGHVSSFPPCPCIQGSLLDDPISILQDQQWNCYYLLPEEKVIASRSTRGRKSTIGTKKEVKPALPAGVPLHKRAFVYKGIDVFEVNIQKVRSNGWLDDSVIAMMLAFYKDAQNKSLIRIYPSQFVLKLLCSNTQQNFTFDNYNFEGVLSWSMDKETGLPLNIFSNEALLFPVCDNSHWILLAYITAMNAVVVCNSSKGSNRKFQIVAEGIKRYVSDYKSLMNIRTGNPPEESKIAILCAEVPQQTNGNDCGVFTIFNGRSLIEAEDLETTNYFEFDTTFVEKMGRESILSTLNKFC